MVWVLVCLWWLRLKISHETLSLVFWFFKWRKRRLYRWNLLLSQCQLRGANPLWSSDSTWARDVLFRNYCSICNRHRISDRCLLLLQSHHTNEVHLLLLKGLPSHVLELSDSDASLLGSFDQVVRCGQVSSEEAVTRLCLDRCLFLSLSLSLRLELPLCGCAFGTYMF